MGNSEAAKLQSVTVRMLLLSCCNLGGLLSKAESQNEYIGQTKGAGTSSCIGSVQLVGDAYQCAGGHLGLPSIW